MLPSSDSSSFRFYTPRFSFLLNVYDEITANDVKLGTVDLRDAPWIHVMPVSDPERIAYYQSTGLHRGEAEAIALTEEQSAAVLLIDERRGRQVAAANGVHVLGTVGLLVEAKRRSHLPAVRPVLDAMIERIGFRVHPRLYEAVLREAGEE